MYLSYPVLYFLYSIVLPYAPYPLTITCYLQFNIPDVILVPSPLLVHNSATKVLNESPESSLSPTFVFYPPPSGHCHPNTLSSIPFSSDLSDSGFQSQFFLIIWSNFSNSVIYRFPCSPEVPKLLNLRSFFLEVIVSPPSTVCWYLYDYLFPGSRKTYCTDIPLNIIPYSTYH